MATQRQGVETADGSILGFVLATDLRSCAAAESGSPNRIKLFPYGTWDRTYEGPWVLDKAAGKQFEENFRSRVQLIDIALDESHNWGPAPGWITNVIAEDDGVYAEVQWTPLGQKLLAEDQYRYVSPEWFWTWKRASDGKIFKHVLTGCALTNKPFFRELPPIAMAEEPMIYGGERRDENGGRPDATAHDTARPDATESRPYGTAHDTARPDATESRPYGTAEEHERDARATNHGGNDMATPNETNKVSGAAGGRDGLAGTPGAVAGQPLAPISADDRIAQLEAQIADERAEREKTQKQNAEQGAALAALTRREQRTVATEQISSALASARPGCIVPPAIASGWAEYLCDLSDTAPQTAADGDSKSDRQTMIDLIAATAAAFPMSGERGANMTPPESGGAMTAEQKSRELDRLAQAKAAEDKSDTKPTDKYMAAVRQVIAERPDLKPE